MRKEFLPFFKPFIEEEEIKEVIDTLKSGWITTGPKCIAFEKQFYKYLSSPAALAVSSCTAALHLSLVLRKIGKGDEVITTPLTFAATANVIEHVGAKPVFVDVEKDTLNIDHEKILKAINNKTKAIVVVHYAGHSCDMKKIMEIAKKYSLVVIEDAAHGLGGRYEEKSLGTFGDFSAFSFYASKNITSAEGGMLVGSKPDIDEARILSMHGINKDAWKRYGNEGSWYYDITYPGFKYNMTDISASLGIHQLKKLNYFQEKRNYIAACYNNAFISEAALEIPTCRDNITHAWHLYPLRLNLEKIKIDKNDFIRMLKDENIGTSVHFIPLHIQPFYKNKYNYKPDDFPICYQQYNRLLSLPLFPKMSDQDIKDVINSVKSIISKNLK